MFVRVTCCAGFGTLPIYNQQNLFAGISLLVKILIRNSRFDKANDAFDCILVYIYCSPEASVVCVNSKGFLYCWLSLNPHADIQMTEGVTITLVCTTKYTFAT